MENFLKHLLLDVEKENPFFKTTLINSGSFYEGTKVGQPDEFDYFVQLDYFSEPEAVLFKELPCSTVIVIPSELGIRKLLKLTPSKFYRYFAIKNGFHWKTCFKAPFVEIFNDKAKGFEAYGMKVLAQDPEDDLGKALQRHGPAYYLELEWTGGERYRGLKISVDLSLAVKINSRSLTIDVDVETSTGEVIKSCLDSLPYFFAVSAYREKDQSGCADKEEGFCLRCSHSCLEQALFHHFGPDGGPSVCLRVLKALRDVSSPDYRITLEEDIEDFESISPSLRDVLSFDPWPLIYSVLTRVPADLKNKCFNRWISSYALKTLVLFEWEQHPEDEQWSGSNLTERFLNILNNLLLSLKQGRLRSFFYKDYNVLPNTDFRNKKIHPVNRVTILQHCVLSIQNGSKYRFEDCLRNISKEVKLTRQKMVLTDLLILGLQRLFQQELSEVIIRTSKEKDSLMILETYIFCNIFIQALLNKIAPEEKLILINTQRQKETVSLRKAVELFKGIADTRMEGLENAPSYTLWSQKFKSSGNEIAKLFEFLANTFKKDIEILLNKLE